MRRLIAARILLLCKLHIRVKSTPARFVILSSRLASSSYARLRLSSSLSPSLPLLALCRFSLYASCPACRCQARLVTSNHLARLSPFPSPPLPSPPSLHRCHSWSLALHTRCSILRTLLSLIAPSSSCSIRQKSSAPVFHTYCCSPPLISFPFLRLDDTRGEGDLHCLLGFYSCCLSSPSLSSSCRHHCLPFGCLLLASPSNSTCSHQPHL